MRRERILLPRVGSQRLPPAARKIRQEAAFGRRELHEVAAEEHVDASEGPRLAVWCVFPRVHPGLGGSDAQVDLGQEPGADHADLVDDEPAPEGHAARGLGGCGAVQRVFAGADAAGAVQGVAADVRGVGGLERADLEVDALQVVQQLLEELADEGQDVGFARAGRAVQQPDQGLAAPQRGLLRVEQVVLHQDPDLTSSPCSQLRSSAAVIWSGRLDAAAGLGLAALLSRDAGLGLRLLFVMFGDPNVVREVEHLARQDLLVAGLAHVRRSRVLFVLTLARCSSCSSRWHGASLRFSLSLLAASSSSGCSCRGRQYTKA